MYGASFCSDPSHHHETALQLMMMGTFSFLGCCLGIKKIFLEPILKGDCDKCSSSDREKLQCFILVKADCTEGGTLCSDGWMCLDQTRAQELERDGCSRLATSTVGW